MGFIKYKKPAALTQLKAYVSYQATKAAPTTVLTAETLLKTVAAPKSA